MCPLRHLDPAVVHTSGRHLVFELNQIPQFLSCFFLFFFYLWILGQHILSVISLVAAAPRIVEPPAAVPHTFNPHLT